MASYDGLITHGDISYDVRGRLVTAQDTTKLEQELLKIVLTSVGDNLFDGRYGTYCRSMIGRALPPDVTQAMIYDTVSAALQYYQELQQISSQSRLLTPAEYIQSVREIRVEPLENDPRTYNVYVTVVTGDLTPATVQAEISFFDRDAT